MSRRVLLPLRTWSGALLVCVLFVCLSGLARPAMAMPGPMNMHVAPHSVASGHAEHAEHGGQAAAPAVAESSPDHGPRCPAAEEQCAAPEATLAQDGPSGQAPAVPARSAACSAALMKAQPNAPPPVVAPPDLHWLCVSRT
ncbi:hypothetical protein [Streptomyces sp. CB03234]|uniref:hypothetical protein n=1 Tax=Streptomyces sp. (strain CB03234) TaxID=1703937 RepID=UPI00117D2796|nr:hypothetical protein [Streptomyces sp. CB03234]